MPVQALGQHFHPTLGRPTKELYSIAGLLFLQETFNWTNPGAPGSKPICFAVTFSSPPISNAGNVKTSRNIRRLRRRVPSV